MRPQGIWRTRWWPLAALIGVLIETWRYTVVGGLAAYGLYRLLAG